MINANWLSQDAWEISAAVRAGECSAQALLAAQFEAIDKLEPQVHAFITQTRERATQQAEHIDRKIKNGENAGDLAGVTIALKDIFDLQGTPTTAAMALHRDTIAASDATVVERLESQGASIVGKVTLTEGVYAEHRAPFPTPINPWHADYWPGASSSGSAIALAAGLCVASIGSETGGSIKLPAAANGVTALKPTWGRVSRHGVFELAASLDHVGPFTRCVQDLALVLKTIAGPDPLDPTAAQQPVPDYVEALDRDISEFVIGVDTKWVAECSDAETNQALHEAIGVLEAAGAAVHEISVPDVSDMIWDWFPVCAAQTALAHRDTFPAQKETYGPALAQLLDMGNDLSATAYQEALLRRAAFSGKLAATFEHVDMIALPVLSFPVPTLDRMQNIDDELIAGLHRFTCPFNMSGSPGLVLPCGFNSQSMPIVFQLIGRHFEEDRLLAAGDTYQRHTDWHRRPATLNKTQVA